MAKTVTSAFAEFLRDIVNLDSGITKLGRGSRDWLVDEQIKKLPASDDTFPNFHSSKKIYFGSFSRRTKIRELDDIDIMIILHADGCEYIEQHDCIKIYPTDSTNRLKNYLTDDKLYLNSRRIINKFVSSLSEVHQYSSAIINRRGEAATLKLKSYSWNFDIVPAFLTNPDEYQRTYYLIPDGNGNWKKTDPRIDKNRTTEINTKHNGRILNIIRCIKYWQRKCGVPEMRSYLLETIMLNYYDARYAASEYVDYEIASALQHLSNAILNDVNDHKGIQGNINNLSWDVRYQIHFAASQDALKANDAISNEFVNPEYAINKWREVFGKKFPEFG